MFHMLRLLAILVITLCLSPVAAADDSLGVQRVQVTYQNDGWYLDADIDFALNPQLRSVAERGLSLYFSADLVVYQPRWWWLDRRLLQLERVWSVSYNALLRQWRVSTGGLALPVNSLDQALEMVRHIRGWRFAEAGTLDPDGTYEARLRLRLDVSQLSRPFQVNALNSSAWTLATPWHSFNIEPAVLGVWQP